MKSIKQYIIAKHRSGGFRTKVKIVLSLLFTFTLLLANYMNISFAQELQTREIKTIDEFERMMKSSSWEDRMFAAQNFFSLSQIDTIKAAEIIVDGIVLETAQPSSLEFHPRSYLNNSERLIRKLIFDLVDLGPSIIELLHSHANFLSGESRAWMLIALALQKDPSAHHEARTILFKNPDPNLRGMAARALYEYADSTDIPVLKEALSDDYYLTISSCTPVSGDLDEVVYPVRQEAASALRRMGYYVLLEGAEAVLKEPGEWEEDQPEKR